ncbi:MAG: UDP-2,4-diacetamido-2,4,6-trideoxy-beta-L-altropyranose hydrolase, partial [Caulobacteraceae bacterium]
LRAVAKVAVIDDLADRKHACDLLIDPGLGHDEGAYAELAPGAKVLSGPAFALVRPEFAALREESLARRAKNEPVRRVLVSLGLTDFGAITQKVMEGILPDASEVAFDVVLGVGCESLDYVKGLEGKGVTLHVNTPDMARLMAGADIAIGAGGSSVWERATLGLPSILVVLADNQHRTAMELSSRGATEVIDRRALAFEAMMSGVWYAVLANADERAKLSRNSSALCDGLGAGRVAAEIMALVSA